MTGVLSGFCIVWLVIGAGMLVARFNVLGPHAPMVLSRLAFFVASPALLLQTLSKADLHSVFALPLVVTASGAIITGLLFFLLVRFWMRRSLDESVMSAMSASLANSANLGIPIAVFVLGDASYVAPLLIFQLAFFTPMYLLVLDTLTNKHPISVLGFPLQILRNPMILGTAVGLILAGTGWKLPLLISEPITLIGGAAIPAMLLAFGMSLIGSRPLGHVDGRRLDTLLATGFKLIVHPGVAFLIARFALGMGGHALFAAVVTAALPTAQNVFVAASRYRVGEVVAKDTVLLTTILAVPTMLLLALLLNT